MTQTQQQTTTETAPDPTPTNGDASLALVAQEEQNALSQIVAQRASRMAVTEPRNFDEAMRFSEVAAAAQMYGVKSKEDAFMRVATGMSLGIAAIQSLALIDVIESKDGRRTPALRAKLKLALCLRATGICEIFECVESTAERATYRIKRRGRKEVLFTYTIEEARQAGLLDKPNWKGNPRPMLRARASSQGADQEFPDLTNGITSTEEAMDFHAETQAESATPWQTVTPAQKRVDELAAEIEAAGSLADLDAVSSRVQAAFKEGDITNPERDKLKPLRDAKKKALEDAAKAAAQTTIPGAEK